jgi:hypothetical protein
MKEVSNEAIVSNLKRIEHHFHDLKCMSGILAEMLDSIIGTTSRYDDSHQVQITPEDLDRLSFAWNDVLNRSCRLEREVMSRLYPNSPEFNQS